MTNPRTLVKKTSSTQMMEFSTPRALESLATQTIMAMLMPMITIGIKIRTPLKAAQTPAAPAAPAKPQLTFDDADAVVWFYAVKGDSGPKFEEFFTRVKEAMAKSTNPERKTQAANMRLMKSTAPAGDGTLNYVLLITPISKGQEYSPGMLLFEVFPTEAKTLVDQLQSYINDKGLNAAVPLKNVMTLGGM